MTWQAIRCAPAITHGVPDAVLKFRDFHAMLLSYEARKEHNSTEQIFHPWPTRLYAGVTRTVVTGIALEAVKVADNKVVATTMKEAVSKATKEAVAIMAIKDVTASRAALVVAQLWRSRKSPQQW
jgi:hypothetical protein